MSFPPCMCACAPSSQSRPSQLIRNLTEEGNLLKLSMGWLPHTKLYSVVLCCVVCCDVYCAQVEPIKHHVHDNAATSDANQAQANGKSPPVSPDNTKKSTPRQLLKKVLPTTGNKPQVVVIHFSLHFCRS